uniref:Uncharacterized protein n=1 Tax=Parascaris univalens TaxID=6257 RepID=A0A915BUA4_PARUN
MSRSNSIKWAVMSGPKFWVGIVISWMYNLVDWPIGCRQNNDRFCVEKALTQVNNQKLNVSPTCIPRMFHAVLSRTEPFLNVNMREYWNIPVQRQF